MRWLVALKIDEADILLFVVQTARAVLNTDVPQQLIDPLFASFKQCIVY